MGARRERASRDGRPVAASDALPFRKPACAARPRRNGARTRLGALARWLYSRGLRHGSHRRNSDRNGVLLRTSHIVARNWQTTGGDPVLAELGSFRDAATKLRLARSLVKGQVTDALTKQSQTWAVGPLTWRSRSHEAGESARLWPHELAIGNDETLRDDEVRDEGSRCNGSSRLIARAQVCQYGASSCRRLELLMPHRARVDNDGYMSSTPTMFSKRAASDTPQSHDKCGSGRAKGSTQTKDCREKTCTNAHRCNDEPTEKNSPRHPNPANKIWCFARKYLLDPLLDSQPEGEQCLDQQQHHSHTKLTRP